MIDLAPVDDGAALILGAGGGSLSVRSDAGGGVVLVLQDARSRPVDPPLRLTRHEARRLAELLERVDGGPT